MFGLIIGAAILGLIIAMMEDGEFPGWGTMIICVLVTGIPSFIVMMVAAATIGESFWFLGPIVGSVSGGCAISATCGMSVKRASIAAAIYCVVQIGISYMLS